MNGPVFDQDAQRVVRERQVRVGLARHDPEIIVWFEAFPGADWYDGSPWSYRRISMWGPEAFVTWRVTFAVRRLTAKAPRIISREAKRLRVLDAARRLTEVHDA
jgi:hypothetical protein